MNDFWVAVLIGIALIASGFLHLLWGDSYHRETALVPGWAGWIFLSVGICVLATCIRGWRRGEGRDPVYTDEDAKRAKAELDTLYLRDHGTPPEAPEEEKKKP